MAYWSSGDFDKKIFIEEAKLYGLSITEVDVKFGYHARDIGIYSGGGTFNFCFNLIKDRNNIKIPITFGQIPGCCGAGIYYSVGPVVQEEVIKILDCLASHFKLGFIQTIIVDIYCPNKELWTKHGFKVVNKVQNLRYGPGNILTIRIKNYGKTAE